MSQELQGDTADLKSQRCLWLSCVETWSVGKKWNFDISEGVIKGFDMAWETGKDDTTGFDLDK